ncbi:LamG domain-containing protein [Clostridium sp. MSJ-11]|uniref:LamG domain-containing protein n=1 Tax=Clostridium mobile TaxID=2841512 RepID=A0ABS6EE26_9CLOT|nr:LamG domain-containing protein [Clostridium mobile]MBU5483449.1 LamG domain-containing protein [Clostridium mobile]
MTTIDRYTKLLLHMDDGSFKDEMGNEVSNIGNVTLDTSNKKFGRSSAKFNKNSLSLDDSKGDFHFGEEDYTIDFWVYNNNLSTSFNVMIDYRQTGHVANPIIYFQNKIIKVMFNSKEVIIGDSVEVNKWYHIALVRSSKVTNLYLNGKKQGTSWNDSNNYIKVPRLLIGNSFDNYGISGNIDELRISKGIARWTSDFTPPIEPYSNDKYLIKQSNDYYSTYNNYLKLGQPTNLDELDAWFKDYGMSNIFNLQDTLTSKKVPMVEGVGNIYESLDVNLNDLKKEDLYITEEDNKTYFEYDYNNYKIIDEIRKINGGIGNVVFKEY